MNRRVVGFVGPAIALLLFGLWAVTLRPAALGGPATYLVIRGDSMEPTYHAGDLVIVRAAGSYAIGDIVAYRVPDGDIGSGHLLVHRIAGGNPEDGFRMLGDNNRSIDPWLPRPGDVTGRAWIVLPGAGRLIAIIRQPATIAALVVALLAGFATHSGWLAIGRRRHGAEGSAVIAGRGPGDRHRGARSPLAPPPTA